MMGYEQALGSTRFVKPKRERRMTHTFRIAGILAAGLFAAAAQSAFAAGDHFNGKKLATLWCASCHVVAEDQASAMADVPTFAAIARDPLNTEERLSQFLADPHPVMPNMSLTRNEVADIVAYIQTLK